MFDEESFSTTSFHSESWLFSIFTIIRSEVLRLNSFLTSSLTLNTLITRILNIGSKL